jgi:hypothetical protein
MRQIGCLTLFAFVLACSPGTPDERPWIPNMACIATENVQFDTAGWRRVTERDFSFSVPPSMVEVPVQPVDSHVRQWISPGSVHSLGFDYGQWSATLVSESSSGRGGTCEATIGGYGVRLATGYAPAGGVYVAGAWRNVRPGVHLTIYGVAADTAQERVLASVLHTVEFHVQHHE